MSGVDRYIDIQASLETVWRLISTEVGMRQWIEESMKINVRPGGRWHVNRDGQMISGEVIEIIPHKKMQISWYEEDSDWVNPTRVTFFLEENSGGVRVYSIHEGFEGIGKPNWRQTYQAYERGWDEHDLLENLRKCAEE